MEYLKYPKLEGYRLLYHSGYWDGPISGMLLYSLERYWFEQCDICYNYSEEPEFAPWFQEDGPDDFELPWYRRYLVYKLTTEQQGQVDRKHADWNALVGFHCDYKRDGKRMDRDVEEVREPGATDHFYAKARSGVYPKLDLSQAEIIGWFER